MARKWSFPRTRHPPHRGRLQVEWHFPARQRVLCRRSLDPGLRARRLVRPRVCGPGQTPTCEWIGRHLPPLLIHANPRSRAGVRGFRQESPQPIHRPNPRPDRGPTFGIGSRQEVGSLPAPSRRRSAAACKICAVSWLATPWRRGTPYGGIRQHVNAASAPRRTGRLRRSVREFYSAAENVSSAPRTAPELTMRAPRRSISSTARAPSPTCLLNGLQASATR